ncbi:MAG: YraN family protein [Phycisphaerae bacterium]|nr:YraN family protein [Phycisphaerae bacterium]
MDIRSILGRSGERRGEKFLRRLGYRLVTRNYKCPLGEIDLIFLDGTTVVFVEVKTRSSSQHADPQDAVNRDKQKRIGRCATYFLRQTQSEHRVCRFDVLAIVDSPERGCRIEHFINAFTPK